MKDFRASLRVSPEEMSTQTDDGVFGRVQTDVTLKRAVLSAAAAAATAAVLSGRLSIRS